MVLPVGIEYLIESVQSTNDPKVQALLPIIIQLLIRVLTSIFLTDSFRKVSSYDKKCSKLFFNSPL